MNEKLFLRNFSNIQNKTVTLRINYFKGKFKQSVISYLVVYGPNFIFDIQALHIQWSRPLWKFIEATLLFDPGKVCHRKSTMQILVSNFLVCLGLVCLIGFFCEIIVLLRIFRLVLNKIGVKLPLIACANTLSLLEVYLIT